MGVCPGLDGVAPASGPDLNGVASGFGVAIVCFLGAIPSNPVELDPSCRGVFSPPSSAEFVSLSARMLRISLAI